MTPISAQELADVLEAVRRHGSVAEAARALGTDAETLEARWQLAKRNLSRRRAQAKYQVSAKGKAAVARYNRSRKRHAANARYRATEHGQRVIASLNQCRVFIGQDYHGRAETADHAAAIHTHVKERIREFKQRFAHREEIKSGASGQVPTEATV